MLQFEAFQSGEFSLPFEIRYEGGDAEAHQLEMMSLGESLQGFGRIYAVVGHFLSTGQYAKQVQVLSVRPLAVAPEAKCFSVAGALAAAANAGVFQGIAGTLGGAIITYIFTRSRGGAEEMKHLRALLEQALGDNQKTIQSSLATIERLAAGLAPAAKKAVSPIGSSCQRIDHYAEGVKRGSLDAADKEAMNSVEGDQILGEKEYSVFISELDSLKSTCKVHFTGDDAEGEDESGLPPRINAQITDPSFSLPDNPYVQAFQRHSIKIKAKAMMRDGEIVKLFISDSLPS